MGGHAPFYKALASHVHFPVEIHVQWFTAVIIAIVIIDTVACICDEKQTIKRQKVNRIHKHVGSTTDYFVLAKMK